MKRVTPRLLRTMPLPAPDADADKEERGSVLVVAGSATVPGASVLTGEAVLRAGAGRLQLAVPRAATAQIGAAIPESLVIAQPDGRTRRGESMLLDLASSADAVVVGPGLAKGRATIALARRIARVMKDDATLVLDAEALDSSNTRDRCIMTPHAGEMATLLGIEREDVERDPAAAVCVAHERFGGVIVLKGSTTYVASAMDLFSFDGGTVGLATSGSGDVLAGIIVGLSGRGADPITAALWGVWAHAEAARRVAKRVGRIGFLARELLVELPALVGGRARRRGNDLA
jgi:hydroxyethylthiazole kinase-like uncharacterized protein yjeF